MEQVANRQYKDRLFKMLFGKGEEENALSLYNNKRESRQRFMPLRMKAPPDLPNIHFIV